MASRYASEYLLHHPCFVVCWGLSQKLAHVLQHRNTSCWPFWPACMASPDLNVSSAPCVCLCGAWYLQASGAALALVDAVVEASSKRTAGVEVPAGYSIARPPGHHATANQPMGFCLLNNVAIAARYAQQHHGLQKVHADLQLHCNCFQLLF